ncbi:hypothetical protein Amsp01_080680 [Amycolatopsis sp. NBRC 101858]|nr:hypothetical protein Amsp01_080680 [Amycolatopsis sp. NBRC 101858]
MTAAASMANVTTAGRGTEPNRLSPRLRTRSAADGPEPAIEMPGIESPSVLIAGDPIRLVDLLVRGAQGPIGTRSNGQMCGC